MTDNQLTLGSKLRNHRESLGLKVEDMAREIRVAPTLVQALEEGRYEAFGAKVYAQGAVRRVIARFPPESGADMWLRHLEEEWPQTFSFNKRMAGSAQKDHYAFYITPLRFLAIVAGVLCISFLVFMGLQVKTFIGTPYLRVDEPKNGIMTTMPYTRVRGVTGKESLLTVNGREVILDSGGSFDREVELLSGLNVLEFIVQNRFGKMRREVRHVVVK